MSAVFMSESACMLDWERSDIEFGSSGAVVRIAVTFCNAGDEMSEATEAEVEAAPLGAFAAWQPLAKLRVPPLAPGERCVLETEAIRPAVQTLGPPDRVSPRQLLTALAGDDRPRRRRRPEKTLPADLFELVGHTNPHWAGNLNVFIGDRAVERHLAQALRIYPGRLNTAFFIVGSGPDHYAFELAGSGAKWDAALYSLEERATLQPRRGDRPLAECDWLYVKDMACLALALSPPADCRQGEVEVHVEQRSSGKQAVVEFTLDASAAGPGCYALA